MTAMAVVVMDRKETEQAVGLGADIAVTRTGAAHQAPNANAGNQPTHPITHSISIASHMWYSTGWSS